MHEVTMSDCYKSIHSSEDQSFNRLTLGVDIGKELDNELIIFSRQINSEIEAISH